MRIGEYKEKFHQICFSNDLATFDPYDIWKTRIGIYVKNLFNKNKLIGLFPAAVFTIYDQFINNKRRIFYNKQEFPIVRALAAKCLLNIYEKVKNPDYLFWAKVHIDWLVNNYSVGYSGYCWGANMVWASKNGVYKKNTPYITNTPYVLEALIQYQEITKNKEYEHVITSIYEFIDKDLNKIIDEEEILCLSYAPVYEPRLVINANSYALYSLSLLHSFFPDKSVSIQKDILKLYNFIVLNQNQDGSWWYYADGKNGNFIDCFHSCFILKNIIKASKFIPLPDNYTKVTERGYNYLVNNFYDTRKGLFKRFTKTDKFSFVKFDLYDNAEMLNLAYLNNDIKLYNSLKQNIQKHFIDSNDIYSVISFFNLKKNKNMLRWAVMPYLHALSNSGV